MNREEKIKLLQDLEAGKPINTINMKEAAFYYSLDGSGLFTVGGQQLNRKQLSDYIKAHPAKKSFVYNLQPGNEPINDDYGQNR